MNYSYSVYSAHKVLKQTQSNNFLSSSMIEESKNTPSTNDTINKKSKNGKKNLNKSLNTSNTSTSVKLNILNLKRGKLLLDSTLEKNNYLKQAASITNRIKKLNSQQEEINKKVDLLQNKYVKKVLIKTDKAEVSFVVL